MTKKKKGNESFKLKKFLFKAFFIKEQQKFFDVHCNLLYLIPILIIVILIFISLIFLQAYYIHYGPSELIILNGQ